MPFDLERLCVLRPFAFHLTSEQNIPSICGMRVLLPAGHWLRGSPSATIKRREHVRVSSNGREIIIRDQRPLHAGNIAFMDGLTMPEFIRSLNSRVFLWPGRESGPIPHGLRHFQRYKHERPVVLRFPMNEIVSQSGVAFCRYNSGSPRCTHGQKSPRGISTFLSHTTAPFGAAAVVEVTCDRVLLSEKTEASHDLRTWIPLGKL